MMQTNADETECRGNRLISVQRTRPAGGSTFIQVQIFCIPSRITSRLSQRRTRWRRHARLLITNFQVESPAEPDEARRIALNIAKLPQLLCKQTEETRTALAANAINFATV